MEDLDEIIFSRHDAGDGNLRVATSAYYAIGLAGGALALPEFLASVIKMHDHKGCLQVTTRHPLSSILQGAIRQAWQEVANEDKEHVEFLDNVGS